MRRYIAILDRAECIHDHIDNHQQAPAMLEMRMVSITDVRILRPSHLTGWINLGIQCPSKQRNGHDDKDPAGDRRRQW